MIRPVRKFQTEHNDINEGFDGAPDIYWGQVLRSCRAIQNQRAKEVKVQPLEIPPKFIAGVDVSFSEDETTLFSAACIFDLETGECVSEATWQGEVSFPYVEGLLAFREGTAMEKAIRALTHKYDVLMISGHGIAHARRCGVASHVSVVLDKPGIGVTNKAAGKGAPPKTEVGQSRLFNMKGEPVGAVFSPAVDKRWYISVGHLITLPECIDLVKRVSGDGLKDPKPVQLAHDLATKLKKKACG